MYWLMRIVDEEQQAFETGINIGKHQHVTHYHLKYYLMHYFSIPKEDIGIEQQLYMKS